MGHTERVSSELYTRSSRSMYFFSLSEAKMSKKIKKNIWVEMATQPDISQGSVYQAISAITERGVKILDVDQVSIWRVNVTGDEVVCTDRFNKISNAHTSGERLPIQKYPDYFSAIQSVDVIKAKDVSLEPQTQELTTILWLPSNIQSNLSVPIWVKGEFEGVVHFDQIQRQREWQPEDVNAAWRITHLVSQTLLVADSRKLEERLDLVTQAVERIPHEENRTETLTDLLDIVVKLMEGDSGMLYLCDVARQEIHMEAVNNIPVKYMTEMFVYGEGIGGLVAKTGRPILIDNLDLWTKKEPVFHKAKLFEVSIACPVTTRGETVGVIQINRKKPDRPFDNSDLVLLKQVADQTAMAIDYYHLSEQNRSFDLFRQMVWQTGTTTHLDVLVENGLTLINRNLSADIGFVQILDAQATVGLSIEVSKKLLAEMPEKSQLINRTLVTQDWKVKDVSSIKLAKVMTSSGIRSSIIAPIVVENETVGYLGVCSSTLRHWTQTEINTVEMTTKQLGMTASQLVSTRERVSLEETLLRYEVVTGNLNHQLSINEALNNIGNGAIHIFQPSHAAIFLQTSKGEVDCAWSYGMPGNYRMLFEEVPKEKISTYLFGSPRLISIPNVRVKADTPGLSDLMLPELIQSISFCPLAYDGQVFGVLGLFFDRLHPLTTVEMHIMEAYANQAAVTLQSSSIFNQLEESYRNIALVLAKAMDERDTVMPEYSQRLSRWAEATAKELGCTEEELKDIRLAALLHDVGKVAIPDSVVKKAGSLTKEERSILKRYPIEGERIIRAIPDLSNVSSIIRNEREHYDGKGYPDGRKGEDIPLGARILAVADAYGSIIDERPYQKARPPEEANKVLVQERGKQFDPVVVDAFLSVGPHRLN